MKTEAITLIITAAGQSQRFGGENKCLTTLNGMTVLEHTLKPFLEFKWHTIIITASQESFNAYQTLLAAYQDPITLIEGGQTRQESVQNAVLHTDAEWVLIHDAARPFLSLKLIDTLSQVSDTDLAVIPGIPISDTIKQIENNKVIKTIPRAPLIAVQTPQRFHRNTLVNCYKDSSIEATDEAMLMEACQIPVTVIPGEQKNRKITYESDIGTA